MLDIGQGYQYIRFVLQVPRGWQDSQKFQKKAGIY